jgi:hypothetical protein
VALGRPSSTEDAAGGGDSETDANDEGVRRDERELTIFDFMMN